MTFQGIKQFLRSFVKERIYDGDNGQPFSVFQIEINKESFNSLPTNEAGFVQLTMVKRREIGKHGDTHYITLWQPKPKEDGKQPMGHANFS